MKNKILNSILLFTISAILLSSCTKEELDGATVDPSTLNAGSCSMSFTMANDQKGNYTTTGAYQTVAVKNYGYSSLTALSTSITGTNYTPILLLQSGLTVGKHTFAEKDISLFTLTAIKISGFSTSTVSYVLDKTQANSLEITQTDDETVQGTFSGTLISIDEDEKVSASVTITNGKFAAKFATNY